ncbi:5025_t:CDS:2, partial [Rhizophagus irregularis]
MDRKNLQDKLDLLSKQMKQIQNEMYSLQEQEDGSNNLSHQSSPQILSVDPLSTPTTVLSQPSQDTRQQSPIPKPSGNYVNIPKTLKLSKITLNDYQNHIRDLVKLHVDLKTEYKNQNLKTIDLVVSKFKKCNTTFPDTINDWAIKMMIKQSINNIRDYYRRKGHDNKKVNKVPKKSSDKYKESTRQIDKSDEIA